MAIQTKRHAQRLRMVDFIHLIDPTMALDAADSSVDVNGVVEIDEPRHLVDLDPRNWFTGRSAFADEFESRIVLQHLAVAIHAG